MQFTLLLNLVKHVVCELLRRIADKQSVEDDAVLDELLMLVIIISWGLKIKPAHDENLIEVRQRFLVNRLLQVKEERQQNVRGP